MLGSYLGKENSAQTQNAGAMTRHRGDRDVQQAAKNMDRNKGPP